MHHIFGDCGFVFKMDWSAPFVPRVGEIIDDSCITNAVCPDDIRKLLIPAFAEKWNTDVAAYMSDSKIDIQQAGKCVWQDWLDRMLLKVDEIEWFYDQNDGHVPTIYLVDTGGWQG